MSYFSDNNSFGIVTVMDAKVFEFNQTLIDEAASPADFLESLKNSGVKIAEIEHLQVATLSTDGPSITINGGKYNNPLIKYGKTARCEMTDALGQADVLVALGGAVMDSDGNLSITDKFGAPVTIVGETFVVDAKTGAHVPTLIILYKFLPDSTPSFAFDSGNAATFDLNGDLLAIEFMADSESQDCPMATGTFFSFVPIKCTLPVGDTYTVKFLYRDGGEPITQSMHVGDTYDFGSNTSMVSATDSDGYFTGCSLQSNIFTLNAAPNGLLTVVVRAEE